jgi:hypothetical protein
MAKKKASAKSGGIRRKAVAPRRSAAKPDNMTVWKGIVTRAWKDSEFRNRLIDDPNGVLAEHGFKPRKGTSYRVVADSRQTKHLILPESARSVRVTPTGKSDPDPGF